MQQIVNKHVQASNGEAHLLDEVYMRQVTSEAETWMFDTHEEFIAEYRKSQVASEFSVTYVLDVADIRMQVTTDPAGTTVSASAPTRPDVLRVVEVFEARLIESTEPLPLPPAVAKPAPRVFIGHGRANDWQTLLIDLQKHDIDVRAFETGARAGHTIRDILAGALRDTDLALLVLTGEDEQLDGHMRARQNVVHEAGLFQAKLGWDRAILLIEDGVEEFSNAAGVIHLNFPPGGIRGVVGDVLAVIRREGLL